MALENRRHLLHHIEIEPEQPIQPGTLHLEHHLTTAAQTGSMNLGQRRRPQGFRVKINDFGAALTQLLFQHGLNLGKTEGGHAVLQGRQLRHPAGWKDVGTSRKQLPELDECRPQAQQFRGQPAGTLTLALSTQLRTDLAAVGPGLSIPPEQQEQCEHRPPDAQCTQQPRHQERTSRD